MLHIGCHLSSAKGYLAMGKEAALMQADTFAFFTHNPRGGKAKFLEDPLNEKQSDYIKALKAIPKEVIK